MSTKWTRLGIFVAVIAASSIAAAAPKNCGTRLEIETSLKAKGQQKAGFTVSSPAGRLELWTTEPMEVNPGIFIATSWTGVSVNKAMCIEVEGVNWILTPWGKE